jgi:hypothetical protein
MFQLSKDLVSIMVNSMPKTNILENIWFHCDDLIFNVDFLLLIEGRTILCRFIPNSIVTMDNLNFLLIIEFHCLRNNIIPFFIFEHLPKDLFGLNPNSCSNPFQISEKLQKLLEF